LYNILIEFGVVMELVTLNKICLNETYSKVRTGRLLPHKFPTQIGRNKEMIYRHSFKILP